MTFFTSNPCERDGEWNGQWMVWDMCQPLPPKPVFIGGIEDAGLVADALNARIEAKRRVAVSKRLMELTK